MKQISKVNKADFGVPYNLSKEKKTDSSTACNLLLQWDITEAFFDCLDMDYENLIIYDAKGRESLQLNFHEVLLNYVCMPKKCFCAFSGVFTESFILMCWNPNEMQIFFCEQLNWENHYSTEKMSRICQWNWDFIQHNNRKPYLGRQNMGEKKLMNCSGRCCCVRDCIIRFLFILIIITFFLHH